MKKKFEDYCGTKSDLEKRVLLSRFELVSKYEDEIGKECEEFCVDEALSFYRQLQTPSFEVLKVYNTELNNFCKYTNNETAIYHKITSDMLRTCVNKELIYSKMINREDLLHIIKDFNNAVEKAVCLCLFEGICGKGYEEIYNIKKEDIIGNEINLISGRRVPISSELKQLILETCDEYMFYTCSETDRYMLRSFRDDSKGLVKETWNSRAEALDDYKTKRKRVYTILLRARKYSGAECIDSYILKECGRLDMMRKLLDQGKDINAVMRDKNMEYIYGRIGNKKQYFDLYREYIRE